MMFNDDFYIHIIILTLAALIIGGSSVLIIQEVRYELSYQDGYNDYMASNNFHTDFINKDIIDAYTDGWNDARENCLMHVRESEMIKTPSGNNCPYCEECLPEVVGDDK